MKVADGDARGGPTSILGATVVENHVAASGAATDGAKDGTGAGGSAAAAPEAAGEAGSDDEYADMATFEEEDLAEDDAVCATARRGASQGVAAVAGRRGHPRVCRSLLHAHAHVLPLP